GPGHGFPAIQANLFVEKALTKYYPDTIPYNEKGLIDICSRFSAPYGYPSHSNPAAPGAVLEGGELGYSLSVAFGTVLDNPDLIACALVGDGEAETGPLAASWQVNKLLSPISDGAVLPILHVNGYKISGPTFFGRMDNEEVIKYFEGLGYNPMIVDFEDDEDIYETMAETMDMAYKEIRDIQKQARSGTEVIKPKWPMIFLKTPKGWTGTKEVDDKKLEGNCLSHQVILGEIKSNEKHLAMLEEWLKSYHFHELIKESSNEKFQFTEGIQNLIPHESMSCGTQELALGGKVMQNLKLPAISKNTFRFSQATQGQVKDSSMQVAGEYFRDILKLNRKEDNFRIFSPDETYSNKIDAVFEETKRVWQWPLKDFDKDFGREGKVMEMLSEHTLFGLMHGYTVTGRHGIFVSYEAFVQVVASMADQYAKFIKASKEVQWRKPLPSLNIILTSLLERQDHNGFSHQNPSFISSMTEKDGDFISAYFPPDANCMVHTLKRCFESTNAMNIIVAGKKDLPLWLSKEESEMQVKDGIQTWDFASDKNPQIVLAASGDYVTEECLAAISLLKSFHSDVRIRFVNVSELTALGVGDATSTQSSHNLDSYFTSDKPVIYNFHGYPQTIKKLLFDYTGAQRITVHGYEEEGSTTTPFDMESRNKTSRYHMVLAMIDRLHKVGDLDKQSYDKIKTAIQNKLHEHKNYIIEHGVDPKEIDDWKWRA
ncbi:phosphoketolase family protein, partial [Candidatus Peregrinibacteria bacterium]|nr:phosphoketolase family protein [Candidatus Peregrinibacteria bacterium]